MTVGSLFSGIGGFDLGLERAGMQVRWQVEIDPFCRRVLEKHWPQVRRYDDVRTLDTTTLDPVDLVCGGFPCQPHSVAGKRKGAGDDRDLWPDFARIIRETRPRWVLAENVPGLLSNDAGRFFGGILRDLAACGYDAEWDCLPASAFGAPHRRDRVWLVAYPSGHAAQPDRGSGVLAGPARDAEGEGDQRQRLRYSADGSSADVADAHQPGPQGRHGAVMRERAGELSAGAGGASVEQPARVGRGEGPRVFGRVGITQRSWWRTEPDVGRVAHGVPRRVDRLRGLGNAIVPQIAEWIGRRILDAELAA